MRFPWKVLLWGLVPLGLGLMPSRAIGQSVLFQETFTRDALDNTAPGLYIVTSSGQVGTTDLTQSRSVCLTASTNVSSSPLVPGCALGLEGIPPGGDPAGSGALRLTSNRVAFIDTGRTYATQGERGSFIINQPFPTQNGLVIEFDFFIYDGRGNGTPAGADGLSFFLIDGATANPTPGAFGGSLGYAQEGASVNTGARGAIAGIGFDEYGNFSNPIEGRIGGPGLRPDSVVVRAGQAASYVYVMGVPVAGGVDDATTINTNTLRSAVPSRRARITLTPDNRLTVELDPTGTGNSFQTLFSNIDLRSIPGQNDIVPPTLKFGFAASTGFSTAIHEIRNLVVRSITTPAPNPSPNPTPPDTQRLRIVKRITAIVRGGVRTEFTRFVNDPNTEDDTAIGWSQLSTRAPIGELSLSPTTGLRSGDDIEYTIYYLADGTQPIFNVNLCDQIPQNTTFVPNSNQLSQNNGALTAGGSFFSPLQPLPSNNTCRDPNNPNGSLLFNLGTLSSTPGSNFGLTRFLTRVNFGS